MDFYEKVTQKSEIILTSLFTESKQLFGFLSEFLVPVLYYGYFPNATIFAHACEAVQDLEFLFFF